MCGTMTTGNISDEAFCEEIFRENLASVRYIVGFALSDKTQIDDIVQETFLEAWAKVEQLRTHPNVSGWLIKTAKNKAMSFNRMKTRKSEELMAEIAVVDMDADIDLIEILSELNPSDEKLITLHYIECLSVREIAAALDIREGAVKVRLNRARNRLRTIVKKRR